MALLFVFSEKKKIEISCEFHVGQMILMTCPIFLFFWKIIIIERANPK